MQAAAIDPAMHMSEAHPNEFDLHRIERALQERQRYRYVTPTIIGISGGYRIQAPCCSRNIDPDGGIVDVALMLLDGRTGEWRLFFKDHVKQSWELYRVFARLKDVLDELNADPGRTFWQ
jgi:hypothetical protein